MKFKLGKPVDDPYSGSTTNDGSAQTGTSGSVQGGAASYQSPTPRNHYPESRTRQSLRPPGPVSVAQTSRIRAAALAKEDRAKSESTRTLLVAAAFPLAAAAAYLILSGQSVQLSTPRERARQQAESANRQQFSGSLDSTIAPGSNNPTSAALPSVIPTPTAPLHQTISANALLKSNPLTSAGAGLRQPASRSELSLILDENGGLVSPFSITLDQDGVLVSTRNREETLALLPPIDRGWTTQYRRISDLNIQPPPPNPPPVSALTMGQDAVRQFHTLQMRVPGVSKYLDQLRSETLARIGQTPTSVKTIDDSPAAKAALMDLRWARSAASYQKLSGETSAQSKVLSVLIEWAKTYSPLADPGKETYLEDFIVAYDLIRPGLSEAQVVQAKPVHEFLRRLADSLYLKIQTDKVFDLDHALKLHRLFQIGFATSDGPTFLMAVALIEMHTDRVFKNKVIALPTGPTPTYQTIAELETFTIFMDALTSMDQIDALSLKHPFTVNMNRYLTSVIRAAQDTEFRKSYRSELTLALEKALYFRPDLYPTYKLVLEESAEGRNESKLYGSYASLGGFLQSLRRKPHSSLDATTVPSARAATKNAPTSGMPTRLPARIPPRSKQD